MFFFAVSGHFRIPAADLPVSIHQAECCRSFSHRLHSHLKLRIFICVIQQRPHAEILCMDLRDRIQINIPVDSGETEEILILTPAGSRPFVNLSSQLVFSRHQIRRQFKFRGCETVLTVAHILSVQPERQPAFCALEGDKYPFPLHALRKRKVFHIACNRIEPGRDFSRHDLFPAIPGILHIRILRNIIALHLNMGRNTDLIPGSAAVIHLLKAFHRTLIILCIRKFPQSVQRIHKAAFSVQCFRNRCIADVVRVGRKPVFTEKLRIFYFTVIEIHIKYPPYKLIHRKTNN